MEDGNQTAPAAAAAQSGHGWGSLVGTWADIYEINGNLCK